MDFTPLFSLISIAPTLLEGILIVVAGVIALIRRRDYLAMMVLVGAVLAFAGNSFHQIVFIYLRSDLANMRTLTIATGLGTFGQLLLGIGFLLMMFGQPRKRQL